MVVVQTKDLQRLAKESWEFQHGGCQEKARETMLQGFQVTVVHCLESVSGDLRCSSPDSLVCTCDKDVKTATRHDKRLAITQTRQSDTCFVATCLQGIC